MNTDAGRRRAPRGLVAALAVLVAAPCAAHNVAPQPVRELVRIQGYRTPAPQGVPVQREMTLIVLGQQLQFAVTEWRVFVFSDAPGAAKAEPPQGLLQGERSLVHPITSARPDQQITVLAERRPGSADLFVLAVDLCPPR
jgi:hypothetical protein